MYRTTPVLSGLGAVRPTWCPGTSLKAGVRDPCEIQYSFDLPIVGQTTFGLPIPQMTNDALLAVKQQLPAILDQTLPTVYQKVQPYIDDMTDFVIPSVIDSVLKKQLIPVIDNQKEQIVAEANVLLQKALFGVAVVAAAGLGGYWYIRRKG